MADRRRVAITGVGMLTPAGHDIDTVLAALHNATSTARRVDDLSRTNCPVTFACPVTEFDRTRFVPVREQRQMDRSSILLASAASAACDAAGIAELTDRERVGVAIGTGAAGIGEAAAIGSLYAGDMGTMPAYTVPRVMSSAPAARLSIRHNATGPNLTVVTACASGATALGESSLKIRFGLADVMIAGGVDAGISPLVMTAFAKIGALSRRNDDPGAACRPFDEERDGFVMGEGATVVVLELWQQAVARGAEILGEVLGYGTTTDAYHIVAPHPDGAAAAACMRHALRDARLAPPEIGHINAHGTSTVLNDRAEAKAIADVFGDSCPPVTASKGVTGHLIGASGAFEAVVGLACADMGSVPPIANFRSSKESDLVDLVVKESRPAPRLPVMSNSFGFGGHNSCLILAPA